MVKMLIILIIFLGLFLGRLKAAGITCKSSIGSTPSCSHPVKDMAQLSEVHPGNYVFYGVFSYERIAVVLSGDSFLVGMRGRL